MASSLHIPIIYCHWLCGGLGLLLIGCALFLYEDDEKKLQNYMEEWWIRVDDLKAQAMSGQAAFGKTVAEATKSGFDGIFGKKLFRAEKGEVFVGRCARCLVARLDRGTRRADAGTT